MDIKQNEDFQDLTYEKVKEMCQRLRAKTSFGLMDCKKSLKDNG